jgi:hypothetical protein
MVPMHFNKVFAAQNIFLKSLLKHSVAEFNRKLLLMGVVLILAGTGIVERQTSHILGSYMTSKLRPCVICGGEMKLARAAMADKVYVTSTML